MEWNKQNIKKKIVIREFVSLKKSMLAGMLIWASFSNILSAQVYYRFAVYFTDKGINSPYSIENPSQFLSQRAIERRARYNIAITEADIPVYPAYLNGIASISSDIKIVNRSRWFNFAMIGTYDSSLVTAIQVLPYVSEVTLLYRGSYPLKPNQGAAPTSGTKSVGGDISSLNYGSAKIQNEMIGVDYLHRKGYLGQDMHIAVLDAGFKNVNLIQAFDHLRNDQRILGTWDFVANDSSVYEDNSHGTNVLSCMAAFIDGKMLGTAPLASYWLLRTEDAATETIIEEYNWLCGAEFADSVGADLINSSLGYTTFDGGIGDHTYADLNGNTAIATKAADIAAGKGILVVNSAGNSGNSGWKYIGVPADGDSVLAVGAVRSDREKAGFSSFGPSADGRIKPNVAAMGQGSIVVGTMGEITPANGTSFSGPIMCGAVACFWQKYRDSNNMEIIRKVEKSASLFSSPNDALGYGIPNFGVADMIMSQVNFEDYFLNQELKIYPNPTGENTLYVDYYAQYSEPILLQIHNAKGKRIYSQEIQVHQKTFNTFTIAIENRFSNGIYTLTIHSSSHTFSAKFVKA